MDAKEPTICSIQGFDASRVVTDADVRQLFEQLPSEHWARRVLCSITYVDSVKEDSDPRRRRDAMSHVFGECADSSDERHATIYRQHPTGNHDPYFFRHCILHELGHAVYSMVLSVEDKVEWAKRHAKRVVSYNAQSRDPDEHFCNLYAAYVLRPDFVRFGFGDFYSFLRERVFSRKEY